jgi:hypothetical protein
MKSISKTVARAFHKKGELRHIGEHGSKSKKDRTVRWEPPITLSPYYK